MCDRHATPARTATLVAHRRELLAFVQRRVGDRDVAEEILQAAFARNLDKLDTVRETALGWFYGVLRNAITDHRRRAAAAERRADQLAHASALDARTDDAPGVACRCVGALAATLKPAYADVLRRVELDGVSVKDYAAQVGITSNNAGVRVFRARAALRKQVVQACGHCASDGCRDCTCENPPRG